MNKAAAYIAEVWRNENQKRVQRGARQLDVHDRQLFCLGLYAASAAINMHGAGTQDISETAERIERSR